MTPSVEQSHHFAAVAARAADDKKAMNVVMFDVSKLLGITDAFVIASGTSDRQVKAIAEEVERAVKLAGGPSPMRIEGLSEASWVLIDFVDFVVHVFLESTRTYYDLERLWNDAPRLEWEPGADVDTANG